MTSSSVSKVKTDITEPKTSSLDTVMWSSQLTRIQGLTKYPPKLGSGVTLFPPHNTDAPCVHNGNGITCSKFVQMKHMSTMMDESNCAKDLCKYSTSVTTSMLNCYLIIIELLSAYKATVHTDLTCLNILTITYIKARYPNSIHVNVQKQKL